MPNYTMEQQQAIETRGRDILVSAAAGSGKTAVLTERILRHITEGENGGPPTDIDRLLVVTFTEAAAAEMRERIQQKITERLKADPKNPHLRRQESLLPAARISTVHAFCRRLIKENFERVDLDPAFKVADETDLSLLKAQVMDDLFEDEYEKVDNEAFLDLTDAFGGGARDNRLDELIRKVFEFIENCPYPEQAAKDYAALFARGAQALDATPWAAVVREELRVGLSGALERIRAVMVLCRTYGGPEKYLTALHDDEALVMRLKDAADKPFEEMYAAFGDVSFSRLYAYRAKDEVDAGLKERAQHIRNHDIKDRVRKLSARCFFTTPVKMRSDIAALRSRVDALMALVLDYRRRYAEEKRSLNVLDFNDLEHYAIQILVSSPVAEGLSLKEVLIDEYQDSNAVQELIFSAAAGGSPRFMVGDVKQSIYRFRRANPKLFIQKYRDYASLVETVPHASPAEPVRIDLSRNFRSRKQVIDTVNFFFSQLMTMEVGEVEYDHHAALYPGADYPEAQLRCETCIELIDRADPETDPSVGDAYDAEPDGGAEVVEAAEAAEAVEAASAVEAEARVIAQRIRETVGRRPIWDAEQKQYRPCVPSDIVILVRSLSGVAAEFTESLKRHGVDAVADQNSGFFDAPEVQTALAFLRVTDNPRQDIALITVLFSPVYAFTADELSAVREMHPDADFYECLISLAHLEEIPHDASLFAFGARQKALTFLGDLERWRAQAAYLPVSRMVGIIYDDTRYPAYAGAMPGGSVRQSNLRLLLERAAEYEETGLTGLFHFIRFVDRLRASGADKGVNAAPPAAPGAESRVRIMTIHRSKGLEFPVVFVSLLGREINREDERRSVVLHQEHGLGPVCVDLEARTRSNTLARLGLSMLTRHESLSEELRVLYVAMTRAKEWLVLTGSVKNLEKECLRWSSMAGCTETALPVYFRREAATFLDWLMPCLARHRDGAAIRMNDPEAAYPAHIDLYNHDARFNVNVYSASDPSAAVLESGIDSDSKSNTESGLEAVAPAPAVLPFLDYPYSEARALPSKVSISEIKRLYAPETSPESTDFHSEWQQKERPVYEPPQFIKQAQGVSATRRGTALHTLMEHIDLHLHNTREAIDGLIADLTARNLLMPEEVSDAARKKVERFVRSPITERMRAASALHREVPFVMGLSPQELNLPATGDADSRILVHGIIDCYFEENGRIILVDYKNDHITGDPVQWAEHHRVQMEVYRKAVARATGREVSEALLYSFSLGDVVKAL